MTTGSIDEAPAHILDFATIEEALGAAGAMFARGEHVAALGLWAEIREHDPSDSNGYFAAATALTRIGRAGEADALLADGQARFAQDPLFAAERAWLARRSGDVEKAAALFAGLRLAAPDDPAGYLEGAACLRELGRSAVAEGVLRDALARFPGDPQPAIRLALLAEEQEDWPQALDRWSAAREAFPDEPEGYLGTSRVLTALDRAGEAEAILTSAVDRMPDDAELLVAHAWAAEHRDLAEALRRLEAAGARFLDDPAPQFGIGAALRELGRLDEADAVFVDALKRFPGHFDVLVNHAWVAEVRADWAEAARRWHEVETAHPDEAEGYLGHAAALAEAARLDDAEMVLAKAARRFPANAVVLIEHARSAQRRRSWQEAVERWERVRARFPDLTEGQAENGVALGELARFDDAELLLGDAVECDPEDAEAWISYAGLAGQRGDWQEALNRWQTARARFPDDPSFWFGTGAVLTELARFDDADAIFSEALRRFPGHEDVLVNHARVAQQRGDWPEALRRWEAVQIRFPGHAEALARRNAALSELGRSDAIGAAPALAVTPASAEPAIEVSRR